MPSAARVELERGLLSADIHLHDVRASDGGRSLPSWTVVTKGLAASGQRELALTLVRFSDDPNDFPPGLIGYLKAVRRFATEGRFVDAGGLSGYRAPGPFGFGQFVGVAFEDVQPIPGVLAGDELAGVLLTEGEFAMAQCSVNRVLSKLGERYRYFPWPFWSDPRRAPVYSVEDAADSLLSRISKSPVRDATATLLGEDLTLVIPSEDAAHLGDRLASGEAVALLPGRDPAVSAALVWTPGQNEPTAITAATGSETGISAWFVALVPTAESNDTVRFLEDGCAAVLSSDSTAQLIAALHDGRRLTIRGVDNAPTLTVIGTRAGA